MNKAEFVKEISNTTGYTEKVVQNTINAAFNIIQATLAKGDNVELKNFGVFKITDVAERSGINPQTKEPVIVPDHKRPHFSASSVFKEIVNNKRPLPEIKKAPAVAKAE